MHVSLEFLPPAYLQEPQRHAPADVVVHDVVKLDLHASVEVEIWLDVGEVVVEARPLLSRRVHSRARGGAPEIATHQREAVWVVVVARAEALAERALPACACAVRERRVLLGPLAVLVLVQVPGETDERRDREARHVVWPACVRAVCSRRGGEPEVVGRARVVAGRRRARVVLVLVRDWAVVRKVHHRFVGRRSARGARRWGAVVAPRVGGRAGRFYARGREVVGSQAVRSRLEYARRERTNVGLARGDSQCGVSARAASVPQQNEGPAF